MITLYATRSSAATLSRMLQNTPRETMILRDENSEKRIHAQVSVAMEKAPALFASFGQDLNRLRQAAIRPDLRPIELQGTVTIQVKNDLRKVDSANVVGLLKGSDSKLRDEYVVYSGHWDL